MDYDSATKHPLCWPDNWPRTKPAMRVRSRFEDRTANQAFDFLGLEMRRLLSGGNWFLSTNTPRTSQGSLNSTVKNPADPGAAVYFKMNGKPAVLACDKWVLLSENIYAIAKHIEALRGQDRWGVGTIEQAFRGYLALPAIGQSSGINWWQVLGVPINATADQAKEAYRLLCMKHHPDKGGDRQFWDRLQEAWRQFNQTNQT